MKKYAITLFVLFLIGVALSVRLFTQDQRLDQTVFIETTESIRNLQALDKNLLLLLYQSRYNSEFDSSELTDTNYQISEEFDNLRFDALFEEIESSPSLEKAMYAFEEEFGVREDTLDSYIQGNTSISNSLAGIASLTFQLKSLEQESTSEASMLQIRLGKINSLIYDLVLGEELEASSTTLLELANQIQFDSTPELTQLTTELKKETQTIIDNFASTKNYFNDLNSLNTGVLLDSIENEYTSYHNQGIKGSNQFRNALVIYGICLLIALIVFSFQIRRNYISLEQEVADRTDEIKETYQDLQESQEQLIQSEKMASLGQMVAGVAHEINTPLGYVTSNIDTLKLNFEDLNDVMNDLGETVNAATKKERTNKEITEATVKAINSYRRLNAGEVIEESGQLLSDGMYGLLEISKLVVSLKDFARLDRQSTEQVDLHTCVDSSVTIASNHIRENNVNIVKEYSELPKISCFPSKLNQLFLNIITNGCQAMKNKGGDLTIKTSVIDNYATVSFTDQGMGMDEETQQKMFDPFFTSKEIGEGTGLGLSIAYKIIEAHKGKIDVASTLGEGTTITIGVPC